jgi:ABC-type transporter Mla subunit MlaD
MQPLRQQIERVLAETAKRKNLIDFSDKLRELGSAAGPGNMKDLRQELKALYSEASRTKGLEEVADSLDQMLKVLEEGGGRIGQFKVKLTQAADTTREKAGIEALTNELAELQKKAEQAGVGVEPLIADLRKLAISPKTTKTLEDASTQLGNIAEKARVKVRKNIDSLANAFGKTADKAAEVTEKGAGLTSFFKRISASTSGLG